MSCRERLLKTKVLARESSFVGYSSKISNVHARVFQESIRYCAGAQQKMCGVQTLLQKLTCDLLTQTVRGLKPPTLLLIASCIVYCDLLLLYTQELE